MQYKNEYRRSIEEYKPALPVRRKIGLYWVLAALRFILTLVPQTGYVHPDEYFQSVEVVSGDYFDIDVHKPWEFNSTFPLRTILVPQVVVGIPYSILTRLSPYTFYYLGVTLRSPYFLIIFPRLLMCGLSFISDYCLYKICCIFGQNYKIRLIIYASSYVMLVYATRTFSNTTELILTSLLLYYTSQCMAFSEKVVMQNDYLSKKYSEAKNGVERVKYYKLKASLPPHSLKHCFKLATITVVGIFNRPTFVAFALAPLFFWLQRGLGSKSVGFKDFHVRIFSLIASGIPTAALFILVDSFYYGYITMAEVGKLEIGINSFVVTPLNFLKYNTNSKNLEEHGLHPRFLHFLINVPLLYNILGVVGLYTFAKMLRSGLKGRWLDMPRIQSIVGLMTASFVVPIALLSIVPHQEPRFIIPSILPLVFLHAPTISQVPGVDTVARIVENHANQVPYVQRPRLSKLQIAWYLMNTALCLFYGFAHQGGVLPMTAHLAHELKAKPDLTHIHLYTSHTYPLPTGLLHLRNTRRTYATDTGNHRYRLIKDFHLHEQGSRSVGEVCERIARKVRECEDKYILRKIPYRLYYALPATDMDEFARHSHARNGTNLFDYHLVNRFHPHVTTEKLPVPRIDAADLINFLKMNFLSFEYVLDIGNRLYEFLQDFELLLVRIEYKPRKRRRKAGS